MDKAGDSWFTACKIRFAELSFSKRIKKKVVNQSYPLIRVNL